MSVPAAANIPVRVAFLLGKDKITAIKWAEKKGWNRIAAFRFTNFDREDVRVVDAMTEFRSFGSETKIYRADGFQQRPDIEKWVSVVEQKAAKWGNRMEEVAETDDAK